MGNFKRLFLSIIMAVFISAGIYTSASAASNLEVHFIDLGSSQSIYKD